MKNYNYTGFYKWYNSVSKTDFQELFGEYRGIKLYFTFLFSLDNNSISTLCEKHLKKEENDKFLNFYNEKLKI